MPQTSAPVRPAARIPVSDAAPHDAPLSLWPTFVAEVAAEARRMTLAEVPADVRALLDATETVPFAHALLPIVAVARRRLHARAGTALRLLAPAAERALARHLLAKMSGCCGQTLAAALSVFRARHSLLFLPSEDGPGRGGYEAFVEHMLDGGLAAHLADYEALAHLVATRAALWVDATVELLDRLAADAAALARAYGVRVDDGAVTGVDAGLSDSHHGGRSVAVLHFAGGARVVYKPRSLAVDVAFNALLAWLNDDRAARDLGVLRVLDRGAYGWVEFARSAPCADAAAAARYYERAGMLLCVAYAIGGTDLHRENVVPRGEHPILIDLEMLLEPRGNPELALETPACVLSTNLLPFRYRSVDNWAASNGGLVEPGDGEPRLVPTWRDVNTDAMRRERAVEPVPAWTNVPYTAAGPALLHDHVEPLTRGFRAMYECLAAHAAALVADDGPLAAFEGTRVRVLLRGTDEYCTALDRSLHPRALRTVAARRTVLGALRPLRGDAPGMRPARAAEQRALEMGDIPHFTVAAGGTALGTAPGEMLGAFRSRAGLIEARARIEALGADDLAQQLSLVHIALVRRPERPRALDSDALPPRPVDARLEAAHLAEELCRLAGRDDAGDAQWLVMNVDHDRGAYRFDHVDASLYAGRAGIGFFLAAAAQATGDERTATLAHSCFAPTLRALRVGTVAGVGELALGGVNGVAGVAYAAARAGHWLQSDELLDGAARAAALLTPDRLAAECELDIVSGAAGTALCLLAVADVLRDARVRGRALQCAMECAERLAARLVEQDDAHLAPLAAGSFAHGLEGAALALIRVGARTARPAITAAGLAWLARSERDAASAPGTEMRAWCRGASGVGLAEVAAERELPRPLLSMASLACDPIGAALDATRSAGLDGPDHLCCGSMGRVDLLLTAAAERGGDAAEAMALASRVAERSYRMQSYGTGLPNAYAPGLFRGIAGIGYQFLRLSDPSTYPSVLLID